MILNELRDNKQPKEIRKIVHEHENIEKKNKTMKKNHTEILELKNMITELKKKKSITGTQE